MFTLLHFKYALLILIYSIFFTVELIVGIIGNSITLQTDAFHMLADMLAIIIGFIALLVLNRVHHRYTYGWVRAEIIAGLVNSVFLLSIGIMLTLENIEKFIELSIDPVNKRLEENIILVLVVAIIGLLINCFGIILFCNEHTHLHGDDMQEVVHNYAQTAVLLHLIGDTFGSILVIISSLVIFFVKEPWKFFLDPLGSILIIIFIMISSSKLLWQCIKILIHRWDGVSTKDIIDKLLTIDGVYSIHEFHVWRLDNKINIASLHFRVTEGATHIDKIIENIKIVLHEYNIHNSTIQPELNNSCIDPICNNNCLEKQCCK